MTPTKTIKLTRAIRRQIYTQDIIMALILTREADKTKPMPRKTALLILRLKNQMDEINHVLYGGDRVAFVDRLTPKDRNRYTKTMFRMGDVLDSAWENNEVGPDFFEAVLMVTDDTAKAVQQSNNKRLKLCWNRLRNSVNTLYTHMTEDVPAQVKFDPDWIGYKYMRLGEMLGTKIEEVMMS